MDEPGVRALLDQLAGDDPPPTRVSIDLARRQGRTRLRWRRAGMAGAPVLAAAAVTAIVVTMSAGAGSPQVPAAGGSASASATPPASVSPSAGPSSSDAPRRFDPLTRYVYWGWLPPGQALVSGQTSAGEMYLTAGPRAGDVAWALDVYAGGRCTRSRQSLTCINRTAQLTEPLRPGPVVNGHPAFWARGHLTWQYARGAWAWLMGPDGGTITGRAEAARVAGTVRFGTAAGAPGLAWAAQLTGLPAGWRIATTTFGPQSGRLLVRQFELAVAAKRPVTPSVTVAPASARSTCYFYPHGQSARTVLNGQRVTVNHLAVDRGDPPVQQVCAARDDGLAVFVSEMGARPALSAVELFRDHLRLLGANPVNWAASPVR